MLEGRPQTEDVPQGVGSPSAQQNTGRAAIAVELVDIEH
jgi:hypothetical protein